MTRTHLLLIAVALLLVVGCAQPGLPGATSQPPPAHAPGLSLAAAAEGARESSSARGGEPVAGYSAWLAATAAPALAARPAPTAQASRNMRVPDGFRAQEGGPARAKRGPDEPYGFVARYAHESQVLLAQVPVLPQLRMLSCEAAAMRMVLAACGVRAGEEEILARMGKSDDPRVGFRGSVDGNGHDLALADYGVYAEVVQRVLRSYGVPATAVRGMGDWQLRQTVQSGKAVVVWVTAETEPTIIEGDGYRLVEGEHVYVVVGVLDDGQLLVHDPWGARADSGRAGTFPVPAIKQWDLFERMAVIVPLS